MVHQSRPQIGWGHLFSSRFVALTLGIVSKPLFRGSTGRVEARVLTKTPDFVGFGTSP